MTKSALLPHPFAEIFPLYQDVALNELVADIKANGQLEPIVLCEEKILDGRNRYTACLMAEVEPITKVYAGDNPLAFVLSLNLHRRHLTESQRAMIAARLATMEQGARTDLPPIGGKSAKIDQKTAATMTGVSTSLVTRANRVKNNGVPELIELVTSGDMSVEFAATIAKNSKEEQTAILEAANPKLALKRVFRDKKLMKLRGPAGPLPSDGKIIAGGADPAWPDDTYSEAGQEKGAKNHYPTQTIEEIMALPVSEAFADDAVLFLWCTPRHLVNGDAHKVLEAWGFKGVSEYIWHKEYPGERGGMGYWSMCDHEVLIIATRGKIPAPHPSDRWRSVQRAPVQGHSVKPDWARKMIDEYYPESLVGKKLEMNYRAKEGEPPPEGWIVWGNEAKWVGEASG